MNNATIPTPEEFAAVSGRARCRTFGEADYQTLIAKIAEAQIAAEKNEPYYFEADCGGVSKSYLKRGSAETDIMGVWNEPGVGVQIKYARVRVNGNGSAPCARYGGKPRYMSDWNAKQAK